MNIIREYLSFSVGINVESQHKIVVSLVLILLLWIIRMTVLRIVWKQTKSVKTRYQWKRSLSLLTPFVGILLIGAVWLPAFKQFGAFLGLFSAGLAIALKDPLTNLAGWFFITFRKPFIVGDRVQIGEHAGDVIDIRIFQFTILEIGNWVDADQSTGRLIHMPNGKVFLEPQANYSTGFDYIWNEIPVRLTFESNWEKAKTILLDVVTSHAEYLSKTAENDIFEASKNYMVYYKHLTPIVYTNVQEYGVRLTIRYLCNPRQRRGTESAIWEDILQRFKNHSDIQFAYPTTRFYSQGENLKN
jgi:small-conductance mechanosensitive channel